MRKHHRLITAEVAIGVADHHAVAEGIEHATAMGLGNASPAATAAELGVSRHGERVGTGEGGVLGDVKVDVEIVFVEGGVGVSQLVEMVGSAARRQSAAVDVRRQESLVRVIGVKADHGCALAGKHRGAVESAGFGAGEVFSVGEKVERQVIGVRPDAQFGVVGQAAGKSIGVEVIGAGGVVGLGDGNADLVGRGVFQLLQQPAVGNLVVEHDGIAAV